MGKIFPLLFCLCIVAITRANAQLQDVNSMADAFPDFMMSFIDNPYHHANTLKIHGMIGKLDSELKDLSAEALQYGSPTDYYTVANMQNLLRILDFFTGNIAGYFRGSLSADDVEATLNPIFKASRWTWHIIATTTDLEFYEYTNGSFKMVLVKNTRPQTDKEDYNYCSFKCYTWSAITKESYWFVNKSVSGGCYRFVEYGDDTNPYKKITKVTSERNFVYDIWAEPKAHSSKLNVTSIKKNGK